MAATPEVLSLLRWFWSIFFTKKKTPTTGIHNLRSAPLQTLFSIRKTTEIVKIWAKTHKGGTLELWWKTSVLHPNQFQWNGRITRHAFEASDVGIHRMQSKLQLQRVFLKAFFVMKSFRHLQVGLGFHKKALGRLDFLGGKHAQGVIIWLLTATNDIYFQVWRSQCFGPFSEPCIPFHHRGFVLSPPMAVPKQVQRDGNSKVLQCQQRSYADQEQSPATADLWGLQQWQDIPKSKWCTQADLHSETFARLSFTTYSSSNHGSRFRNRRLYRAGIEIQLVDW